MRWMIPYAGHPARQQKSLGRAETMGQEGADQEEQAAGWSDGVCAGPAVMSPVVAH